jgi:SAM-dependent methyltransferase
MTSTRSPIKPSIDYENLWRGFWNDSSRFGPAPRHRRRIVANIARTLPHESLIDLGCGNGGLIAELKSRGLTGRFAGADVSESAVRCAQENVPGAKFFTMDLIHETLPEPYDIAVLSEVLEHLEDDSGVLEKLAPRVKYVIVSVPGGSDDKVDTHYGHFRNYPGRMMADRLEAAGFDVIHFRRWGFPFYDSIRALITATGRAGELVEGPYSPLKRITANLIYGLCFLNVLPAGWQVFAAGKSRVYQPGRPIGTG